MVRGSLLLCAGKPCFVMARYLSRADLSRIAGKYIDQYYTRFRISKDALEPIDPERLASAVLGLNVKMLPLCSDGSILGLTVFQRCGFTVTLGDGNKACRDVHAEGRCDRFRPCGRQLNRMPEFHDSA